MSQTSLTWSFEKYEPKISCSLEDKKCPGDYGSKKNKNYDLVLEKKELIKILDWWIMKKKIVNAKTTE